ncbi:MAG: hypothetical protein JO051_03455 [Acidobacteriaceae bacterium]|nr:hypothetical protein [Acidobacteriaceae bacterium]
MALPTPTPELVTADAPQNRVGGDAFSRTPEVGIGQGLSNLGAGAEDVATTLAKQAGAEDAKAVTLDANGVPSVATAGTSFILGRAGAAYQNAREVGADANIKNAVTRQYIQMHQDYLGDPDGFLKASNDYATSLRSSMPGPIGEAAYQTATSLGTQHWHNLVDAKATSDVQTDQQAITTRIGDLKDNLAVLARNGGTDQQQFKDGAKQLNAEYDKLAANQLFGFSQEKIDSEKAKAESYFQGEAVVGNVDRIFYRKGPDGGRAAAHEVLMHDIMNNPNLNMGDNERSHLVAVGMARLQYLSGEQEAWVHANSATLTATETALAQGKKIDDATLDMMQQQFEDHGFTEGVRRIEAARQTSAALYPLDGLAPGQVRATVGAGVIAPVLAGSMASEAGALNYFKTQGWTPEQAAGIVGNLVHESGGRLNPNAVNPGDGSDGSDSIGIGQWNGQRAKDLKAFAASQGKQWNDLGVQLAFVHHELTQGSEQAAGAAIKGATTVRDATAATAINYERPRGSGTGIPENVLGWQNRLDQATRLSGGGASTAAVSVNSIPFTADQVKANPFLMSAWVKAIAQRSDNQLSMGRTLGAGLERQVSAFNVPNATEYANFMQLAQQHPDELGEMAKQINIKLMANAKADEVTSAQGGGPSVWQATKDEATRQAQGGSIYQSDLATATGKAIDHRAKELEDNPWQEAARRGYTSGMPIPLNPANPVSLPTAMAQRGAAAASITSRTQVPQSMLSPDEVSQAKAIMTGGPLDQRMALLGGIANAHASEPVMKATLGKLAADSDTLPLAVAGSLTKDNPDAARAVVQGQALLQQEPKLAPEKKDIARSMSESLPFPDFPNADVRNGFEGAIKAYYAKLSADANDTTGSLNQDRWDTAVKAVTGGVSKFRGSKVIAPWYGASDAEFDGAVRSLTDGDFANARTPNGEQFPASALKPSFSAAFTWNNWRLQSQGDGKYTVFSGPDDPTKRVPLVDANTKQPFVLDLSTKRGQAAAAPIVRNSGRDILGPAYSPDTVLGR